MCAMKLTFHVIGSKFTPATPEQEEAYRQECVRLYGEAYDIRTRQAKGELTKEEADALVREARLRRKSRRARERRRA
jgi:hypothetical protein